MCLSKQVGQRLFCYKPTQTRVVSKVTGFSLIELMVVMAIMAVLMSLSGGLMQKSINQQTRQVELEQVRQLFKNLSYRAYYGGGAMQVRLEKNQMQITYVVDAINFSNDGGLAAEEADQFGDNQYSDNQGFDNPGNENQEMEFINFAELTFVAQDFNVSSKGIVTPNQYQVFWLEGIKTFQLKSLFSEYTL
ncbi:type II secretion system protein [Colwellia sp. TT2012]|uniref:type II secretion system protein n=1 Tax=Colwellia sp. TT2012 TaxID=1720342 RepID=UPI00070EB009|nr:type II secretion system protein [Colwellia sp. TT2012]